MPGFGDHREWVGERECEGESQLAAGDCACLQYGLHAGTGHAAHVPGLDVAGKTGTAEPGQFDDEESEQGPGNGWFVAFAPAQAPELVVGAVCHGGGHGGRCAAPIAGVIFREALAQREP